jgi:hypothetical protein
MQKLHSGRTSTGAAVASIPPWQFGRDSLCRETSLPVPNCLFNTVLIDTNYSVTSSHNHSLVPLALVPTSPPNRISPVDKPSPTLSPPQLPIPPIHTIPDTTIITTPPSKVCGQSKNNTGRYVLYLLEVDVETLARARTLCLLHLSPPAQSQWLGGCHISFPIIILSVYHT